MRDISLAPIPCNFGARKETANACAPCVQSEMGEGGAGTGVNLRFRRNCCLALAEIIVDPPKRWID